MPTLATHPNNGFEALATSGGQELLIVSLTVQLSLLLHKALVYQWTRTLRVGTLEVVRAPGLVQGEHKWAPASKSTNGPLQSKMYFLFLQDMPRNVCNN